MEKPRLIRRPLLGPVPPERTATVPKKGVRKFSPPRSGHKLYALVGEISTRWSFLEFLLDLCIATLADTDQDITTCITAQMMGHGPRCLTIIALAHWRRLPDIEDATKKLMGRLFEAAELRNRAIHDALLIGPKKVVYKDHRMSKKDLKIGLEPFDTEELKRALSVIDSRRQDCVKLLSLIRDQAYEYYPSPERPP